MLGFVPHPNLRAESAEQRAAAAESELARLRDLLKQQGIDLAG